jgi:hypothetical protein
VSILLPYQRTQNETPTNNGLYQQIGSVLQHCQSRQNSSVLKKIKELKKYKKSIASKTLTCLFDSAYQIEITTVAEKRM